METHDDRMEHLHTKAIVIETCNSLFSNPHSHTFLELAYVQEGEAIHKINGMNPTRICEGDYFIIDYRTEHEYRSVHDEPFSVINCLFLPELIDKGLAYCRDFQTLLRHYMLRLRDQNMDFKIENRIFHDQGGEVLRILRKMLSEYQKKALGWREMLRAELIEVIITAARNLTVSGHEEGIVQSIQNELYQCYNSQPRLSDFAKQWNYSLPYLSKRFKEETGCTYQEYLMRIRIQEACRLLVNTDKKVSEIAELVGYTDVDFFYQTFRKHMGKTPNAFRKSI